ncbi:hypothetical protein NL676_037016 [Syzygium grande]|nr:hypothetical protein NL676_037016 [Syzygium grande]
MVIGYINIQRNAELDPEKQLYPGGYFNPLDLASNLEKKEDLQLLRSSTPALRSSSLASRPPSPAKARSPSSPPSTNEPNSTTSSTPTHPPPPQLSPPNNLVSFLGFLFGTMIKL